MSKKKTDFKREDLKGLAAQEIQDLLLSEFEKKKKEIAEITTEEGTLKYEENLMKEMDEYDKYLRTVMYDLAESCDFDGKQYTHQEIADLIIDFINTQSVNFDSTLGLYQLVKFWESGTKQISYHVFDSTLRVLNLCKFKGMDDWTNILAINAYLSTNHTAYTEDTAWFVYLSNIHNAIIEHHKLFETVTAEG